MIGGNTKGHIQTKKITRNEIGEMVEEWTTTVTLIGYLDYTSGQSRYDTYKAKIEESDHVFVSDYFPLENIRPNNSRMMVNNQVFDITFIDNPMLLNRQLEIYLKKVA